MMLKPHSCIGQRLFLVTENPKVPLKITFQYHRMRKPSPERMFARDRIIDLRQPLAVRPPSAERWEDLCSLHRITLSLASPLELHAIAESLPCFWIDR